MRLLGVPRKKSGSPLTVIGRGAIIRPSGVGPDLSAVSCVASASGPSPQRDSRR